MFFRLAELRKRKGITQRELAENFSVSPQTISKWETGVVYPDLEMLPIITEYFGVSADMLLGIVPLNEDYKDSDAGDKEYWSKQITYLEKKEKNMWNQDYMQFLIQHVWKINTPVKVLDCGCGYGALGLLMLPMLPEGSKYVGIDFSEVMIQEAKKRFGENKYDSEFIKSDVLEYNAIGKYDVVICQFLLRHVNGGRRMIQKMISFLKPGGLIISIECNREFEADGLYIDGMDYDYLCRHPGLRKMWSCQLKKQERDYSIAMKIPYYLKEAGIVDIGSRMNDKVTFIEPQMKNYRQALENMIDTEKWFDEGAEDEKIVYLMNHGMSNTEARDFCRQQREIGQYLRKNDDVTLLKIYGTIITYGRKANI